jgi:hypothetical protein
MPKFWPPNWLTRLVPSRTLRAVLTVAVALALAGGVAGGVSAALRHGPLPDEEETEPVHRVPDATTGSCGVGKINLQSTTSSTIASLVSRPAPSPLPSNSRVAPTETTVFRVAATLTEYKLEADSDYHLVLSDGSGHTMIAEIPDPACVAAGSPLLSSITKARAEFDAKFNATSSFQTANVPVTVTGVGFFDFLHGQTGVAPNGIELHAVLDIAFGGGGGGGSQLLGNPGFETGTAAPWSASTGVISNRAAEPPHSGSWDAWLDGYGTTHTDTLSQSVAIPASASSATLSFWLHVDTAETSTTKAFDTLKVQVLGSSGTVLATLATYSNLTAASAYTQHSFSLASYLGQTITLKFTGAEDSVSQTSFVLDDTAVTTS